MAWECSRFGSFHGHSLACLVVSMYTRYHQITIQIVATKSRIISKVRLNGSIVSSRIKQNQANKILFWKEHRWELTLTPK